MVSTPRQREAEEMIGNAIADIAEACQLTRGELVLILAGKLAQTPEYILREEPSWPSGSTGS